MTTFDNNWLIETATPLLIGILQDNLETVLELEFDTSEQKYSDEIRTLIDSYKRVLQDFMPRSKYNLYITQLEEQYDGV
jgi:hypothetical protein